MIMVKGYLTAKRRDEATGRMVCKHVAQFADGTVKITSGEHLLHGSFFNKKGWTWEVIPAMPEVIEFCGNYPADM